MKNNGSEEEKKDGGVISKQDSSVFEVVQLSRRKPELESITKAKLIKLANTSHDKSKDEKYEMKLKEHRKAQELIKMIKKSNSLAFMSNQDTMLGRVNISPSRKIDMDSGRHLKVSEQQSIFKDLR